MPRRALPLVLLVTGVALVAVGSCKSEPTAVRIVLEPDPGLAVDHVRVEVQLDGQPFVSAVVPETPTGQVQNGADVLVLFDDTLGGQTIGLLVGALQAGAEIGRGSGSVALKTGETVSATVALHASTTCPTGQHACNETCYPDDDAGHCGLSCVACTVSGPGAVACHDSRCVVTCSAGYTDCDRRCVLLDSDPANCGACGTVCAPRDICRRDVCSANPCPDGQHECDSACVSDVDVAHCGHACTPCPAPAHATATCDGVTCGVVCDSGYQECRPGACADIGSPQTCGPSCTACPPPPLHGRAVCDGLRCGIACEGGYHLCTGVCKPLNTSC